MFYCFQGVSRLRKYVSSDVWCWSCFFRCCTCHQRSNDSEQYGRSSCNFGCTASMLSSTRPHTPVLQVSVKQGHSGDRPREPSLKT